MAPSFGTYKTKTWPGAHERAWVLIFFVIIPHAQRCCPEIFLSASKTMSILSVGTKQSEDITMALLSQNWKWLNNNNVVHRVHIYCHLMSVLSKLVKVWMYIYQDTCKRPC